MNYKGKIIFEKSRKSDVGRYRGNIYLAKKSIDFESKTSIEEGLKKTIEWYREKLKLKSQ